MKFGEYLKTNALSEWQDKYLNYDRLKSLIKVLEDQHLGVEVGTGVGTSLSVPLPTNAAGMPRTTQKITQEEFFEFLESEMKKIERFTQEKVPLICCLRLLFFCFFFFSMKFQKEFGKLMLSSSSNNNTTTNVLILTG